MSQDVLLVSYNFLPYNTPASQRIASFAHALQAGGHTVHVVTARTRREMVDEALRDDIGAIRIWRTGCWELDNPHAGGGLIPRLLNKLGEIANRRFLPLDASALWVLPAFFKARRVIRHFGVDRVLISSPPHSSQLVGVLLKRFCGVKVVADFRDGWTHDPVRTEFERRETGLGPHVEPLVLRNADTVVANTPTNKRMLLRDFPEVADKVHVVLNGYLERDTRLPAVESSDPRFKLVYTGDMYPGYTRKIFSVLARLKAEVADFSSHFVFNMAGHLNPSDWDLVREFELQDVFDFKGFVPYQQSLTMIREADALLLVMPDDCANVVGSKLYTYLGQRKPILAIVPDGDAAAIIRDTGAGVVVTEDQEAQTERILQAWVVERQPMDIRIDDERWRSYSRERQADHLLELLDEL